MRLRLLRCGGAAETTAGRAKRQRGAGPGRARSRGRDRRPSLVPECPQVVDDSDDLLPAALAEQTRVLKPSAASSRTCRSISGSRVSYAASVRTRAASLSSPAASSSRAFATTAVALRNRHNHGREPNPPPLYTDWLPCARDATRSGRRAGGYFRRTHQLPAKVFGGKRRDDRPPGSVVVSDAAI